MLTDKKISPFDYPLGEKLYSEILATVRKNGMDNIIKRGVVLGLSGGPDSVLLAHFLSTFRLRCETDFSIVAVHINHCIRGGEADRDEDFSRTLAKSLGLEFISFRVDVPSIARELGLGVEEAARNVRYSKFDEIISSREDLFAIAVAHNATDNIETILFNTVRGAGLGGACGIAPVRDNIIRPLIEISKSRILALLDETGYQYVLDSTNVSQDYSRNYIRHSIMPMLSRINAGYENSLTAFGESAREAVDFIDSTILPLCEDYRKFGYLSLDMLSSLHSSQLARLIITLSRECGIKSIDKKQITAIKELISGDNFRVSLSSGVSFVVERGRCSFVKASEMDDFVPYQRIILGENLINGTNGVIIVGEDLKSSLNVYKISIQADLSSAIIIGDLYCRRRCAGDAYFFGGMTHKLKKVFNDRGIPPSVRDKIPIICDDKGIVWVPGLSVRDDYRDGIQRERMPISFATVDSSSRIKLYSASYDALE